MSDDRLTFDPRYQSLDLWRGIACLVVIVNHGVFVSAQVPAASRGWIEQAIIEVAARLWIGVPAFFVISGYCISAAVQSRRFRTNGLPDYAWRRFRRIYPPAWIVLLGTCALVTVLDLWIWPQALSANGTFMRPWWVNASQWVGNLTLTETWRPHVWGSEQRFLYLGHYWTLCYEEQFYVVLGLLAWTFSRHLFSAVCVVSALSIVVQLASQSSGIPIDGFFFDGQWHLFAMGVLVFFATNGSSIVFRRLACVGLLGVALAAASQTNALWAREKNLVQELFVGGTFASLLIAIHSWDVSIARTKWLFPVTFAGQMCYSLYLVHLPVTRLLRVVLEQCATSPIASSVYVTIPLSLLASLAIAWPFHQFVERRFLNTQPARS